MFHHEFIQDFRYALRRLVKRPIFALTLILTLGLGIGANVAVFSLVYSLLVKGLPYANSDRLVLLRGLPIKTIQTFINSQAAFDNWKSESNLLHDAALFAVGEGDLLGGGDPLRLKVALVTANLFDMLGVAPRLGRRFLSDEEISAQANASMISERLWRSQFGGDGSIYGKTINLNGEQYTVVGVVPAGYEFPAEIDIWIPKIRVRMARGKSHALISNELIARMKPGSTIPQVEAQQLSWLRGMNLDRGASGQNISLIIISLREHLTGDLKQPTLLLLGAVALVLLIACANVANMTVVDSISRGQEFTVRQAIGMSPRRFLQQFITEHILIGVLGGLSGMVMAYWSLPYLKTYLPEEWPKFADVSIDFRALVFALGTSMLIGGIVGSVAYLRYVKATHSASTSFGWRGSEPPSHKRWREVVVCIETGLAFGLLVAAALFIQTLQNLVGVDYGFKTDSITVASVSRQITTPQEEMMTHGFYADVITRLRSLPGAHEVGGINYLPVRQQFIEVNTVKSTPDQNDLSVANVGFRVVTPGFFRAMSIPLLAGRDFNEADAPTHQPVAIIDQTLANKLFPGRNSIDQQIFVDKKSAIRVVGVVGPIRPFSPYSPPSAEIYLPLAQSAPPHVFNFVLRAGSISEHFESQIRSVIRDIDSKQSVELATMNSYIALLLHRERSITGMLTILSLLGFVLAIVGVYGLVSYTVASRMREFGIRLALGEERKYIFLRSIAGAGRAVLPGVALGILFSLAAGKLLESQLFGIRAMDMLTLAAMALLLTFIAVMASVFAARRAAFIDPLAVLRE